MRMELGPLRVEFDKEEDAGPFLRGLFRHLNNTEVAEILGVSVKTVGHWKREGRLPERGAGQIMLLDLLHYLDPKSAAAAKAMPANPAGEAHEARDIGRPPGKKSARSE